MAPAPGGPRRPPWVAIAGGLVAVLVVAAVLFLLLSGGDDSDSGGETASTGTDETTTTDAATETTTESGDPTIGAALPLPTFETTVEATVTEYRVATAGNYDNVPAGGKLVGVEFSLENTGNQPYSDSPGNGARLRTTTGVPLKPYFPVGGDCSSTGFSSAVSIPAAATRSGCIAFKLRAGQQAEEFEWTPNSGFGDESASWVLPPLG